MESVKEVISIRPSITNFLQSFERVSDDKIKTYTHPFYSSSYSSSKTQKKQGAITLSRVGLGKNLDMVYEANKQVSGNENKIIHMYGSYQSMDVFRMMNGDREKIADFNSYYKGKFTKEFNSVKDILSTKKFVIDLTSTKNDGGGTQYTFLEAIENNCCLVLHESWIKNVIPEYSVFESGYNCLTVSNKQELVELLEKQDRIDVDSIIKNSKKLLNKVTENNKIWNSLLS